MSLFFFLVFKCSYSVGTQSCDRRESGHCSVDKAFGMLFFLATAWLSCIIKGTRGQRDMYGAGSVQPTFRFQYLTGEHLPVICNTTETKYKSGIDLTCG